MDQTRSGDLVLSQGTFVLLQEGTTGIVKVVVGPHKVSLGDTDKPVVYERNSRIYAPNSVEKAIRICPAADEEQYIVLTNPTTEKEVKAHPPKGTQDVEVKLDIGSRVNIQGPETFALWPGQVADVIEGHQLKSNEYLIIRVYNEEEAKANLKDGVVKTVSGIPENKSKKSSLFKEEEIRTGNLLIIQGTNVSFYIPPTGIEVLVGINGNYTRDAVTLERLEYCILLDQNGDKRYVKGPAVVFPKPTESFIENDKRKVFKAIELNENMALYIKVIADYSEDNIEFISGDELFITGKDQKIYFPRAEHAIIKYSDETIHYATAVPSGEGRYILDKKTGSINTIKGPKMLLPDPRNEVIVKRVLNEKTVNLWFPGNKEAIKYNLKLKEATMDSGLDYTEQFSNVSRSISAKSTLYSSSIAGSMTEEMNRHSSYTKPRTIQLNTKYDGAVLLNIWPDTAIQVVNKIGDRKLIEGPKVVMLDYDETLDVLELSSGKPKNDTDIIKTVYLQTKNNVVSDFITVETKDIIDVNILLSYKVNFEGDCKKWFNVSNYVKLLTQHMRSVIRNAVKKQSVEEFYESATDIIRDVILGKQDSEKNNSRKGKLFTENNMKIYDVEVLNIKIGDKKISDMIVNNQHAIVQQNLKLIQMNKDATFDKESQLLIRDKITDELETDNVRNSADKSKLGYKKELEYTELANDIGKQEHIDELANKKNARLESKNNMTVSLEKDFSEIRIKELKAQMDAIAPGLIEAMISSNSNELTKILAENITAQRDNNTGLSSLINGSLKSGLEGILETVAGTPHEEKLLGVIEAYKNMQKNKKKK